jgi:hypothetical protein
VVDLRRAGLAARLGVDLKSLTGARSRAHSLARQARELGAEGMIVPSAARRDAWNLVVFPAGFGRVQRIGSRAVHPRPPA